ncbi:MAG: 3-keto-5-aminohexanoate cleavage protein [Vicinamibacterales bacterium]
MPIPAIITVAITGSVPTKRDTPAVPVEPNEQIESTQQAFEAGAAVVHIHVRDAEQRPSSDPERFARVLEGVRKYCPGMIVQFSTGGRGRHHQERGVSLALHPDMASLSTGSVNFATFVYENPPELVTGLAGRMLELGIKPEVEVFDLAMLYNGANLVAAGLIKRPAHVQFVLGIPNALPARESVLDVLIAQLEDVMSDATWGALGIGRHQLLVNRWALARGGHVRTGLEDNIYKAKGVLAQSNAELVGLAVDLCSEYDRRPATPAEARALLGLPAVAALS